MCESVYPAEKWLRLRVRTIPISLSAALDWVYAQIYTDASDLEVKERAL